MVAFIPVLYVLGGMAVRAMTATVAKKLAQAGAKKATEAIAKKNTKNFFNLEKIKDLSTDKALSEFLKRAAILKPKPTNKYTEIVKKALKPNPVSPLKKGPMTGGVKPKPTSTTTKPTVKDKPTISLTVKPSPKSTAKPKVDKTVNKPTTKPKSATAKPKVKTPKKVTTTQKTTGANKPTVNTTTTKPKTPKPKPKPKSTTKTVKKPSNTPRNAIIVAGIGGAGYFLDKLVNKDKPVKVDKTTDRPKRESTPITSEGPPQRQPKKDDKLKNLRTTPKDEDAILSKIAAPKPKSNISKFGRAFKNARKQRRYSFNFNGKEITTRFKEETVAEHKKKFGKD